MYQQEILLEAGALLEIIVSGDITISGIDGDSVQFRVIEERRMTVNQDGQSTIVRCEGDCLVDLPADTPLRLRHASKDAVLRGLSADVLIDHVGGDLLLEGGEEVTIELVGGDCSISSISGDLVIRNVGGDLAAKNLSGSMKVDGIGGDLNVVGIDGDVDARAGGDIKLSLRSSHEQDMNLSAGGDVKIFVPQDPQINLSAVSGGHAIRFELAGRTERHETGTLERVLGSGGSQVSITAGGDVTISDGAPVESEGWSHSHRNLWEDRVTRMTEKAKRKAETQREKAERRAERANERAQRAVERAEERVKLAMERLDARKQRLSDFGAYRPSSDRDWEANEEVETPSATEEEKRLILQMLQDRKISIEEADRLLNALEGRKS